MSDKWLNGLMITGLVVMLGIVGYMKMSTPKYPAAPETTGAVIDEAFTQTFDQPNPPLDQFYELMDKTPVTNDYFEIKADYDEINLVVTLKEPVEQNQQYFFDWLETNGYGQIPADKIVLN